MGKILYLLFAREMDFILSSILPGGLLVVLSLLGLCMGLFGYNSNVVPSQQGGVANCGGVLSMWLVRRSGSILPYVSRHEIVDLKNEISCAWTNCLNLNFQKFLIFHLTLK